MRMGGGFGGPGSGRPSGGGRRADRKDKKDKKDFKKGPKRFRKKVCKFCIEKLGDIDYKDVSRLQRCVTERGKIISRRITGNCARHQRFLAVAIKRAREIALLPYTLGWKRGTQP